MSISQSQSHSASRVDSKKQKKRWRWGIGVTRRRAPNWILDWSDRIGRQAGIPSPSENRRGRRGIEDKIRNTIKTERKRRESDERICHDCLNRVGFRHRLWHINQSYCIGGRWRTVWLGADNHLNHKPEINNCFITTRQLTYFITTSTTGKIFRRLSPLSTSLG